MERNNRDLRNIILVLGTAICSALLLALVFIFYYSPSGSYIARDTLLDPSLIDQINIRGRGANGNRNLQFVFDRIEFSCFDKTLEKMRRNTVPFDRYQTFYAMVARDISFVEPSKEIQILFDKTYPILLTIQIRAKEGGMIGASQLFQEVQFIEEDYFRVRLRTSEANPGWVYYYHKHLYNDIMNLFSLASER